MMISYIVPCFNHALYIERCLKSIFAEATGDDEVIVVDDGSTDNSFAVIESFRHAHPALRLSCQRQKNQGICKVLNTLFGRAQGDFIRLVSSDDEIIMGSTQTLIAPLLAHPEKDAAFGDVQTVDASGQPLHESHLSFSGKRKSFYQQDLSLAIIRHWGLAGPCVVYRKNFMKSVGPYDETILVEDWNMFLRLAAQEKLIFVDAVVARYRIHDLNTSRTLDTARRIKNLKSQRLGGLKCVEQFNAFYAQALVTEIKLIEAKINFLERHYFKTAGLVLEYLVGRLK